MVGEEGVNGFAVVSFHASLGFCGTAPQRWRRSSTEDRLKLIIVTSKRRFRQFGFRDVVRGWDEHTDILENENAGF